MIRVLAALTVLAAASTIAHAQCFEANFGTLMPRAAAPTTPGVGDDVLFDLQPLNFTFPMPAGGVASSFTHAHVGSNGVMFLTNGAASGATSTGYSTLATTMVTNLRGTAGQPPRIAAYWRDLNMLAANSGGVWFNNTIPGKFVVTWANAVHYAQTTPVFTVQAQLFASGEVRFFYSGTTQNTATCPVVGVSVGNLVADPGVTDLSLGTAVSAAPIVYQTFPTVSTFDLQTTSVAFLPAGTGYVQTASPCVPAGHTTYGAGCYTNSGTVYELFAANTIDLSNTKVHLIPNGVGGYTAIPGSGTNFVHTQSSLMLTDDSVGTLNLPGTFNYPGGVATAFDICSNGYIWMQSPNTLADFSPTAAELFSNPARLCPMWCDALPDGATGVNNVFAEVDFAANKAYVTWANVPIFGGVGGNMDVQVEFFLATGEIEIRYGAISCGNTAIVGWTPGTLSTINAGSRDISATLPASFSTQLPEQLGLAMSAAPSPILGTTVNFTTNNIPAGAIVSSTLLGFTQVNPGIDLGFLGAPGCSQYVDSTTAVGVLGFGSPSVSVALALPNLPGLSGLLLFGQTVSLVPGVNALGAVTSNGVRSYVNTF